MARDHSAIRTCQPMGGSNDVALGYSDIGGSLSDANYIGSTIGLFKKYGDVQLLLDRPLKR